MFLVYGIAIYWREGLVAYTRVVPPSSSCGQPGMASGQDLEAKGRAGCQGLCYCLQRGDADDVYEFQAYQGNSRYLYNAYSYTYVPLRLHLKHFTPIFRVCVTPITLVAKVSVVVLDDRSRISSPVPR